MADIEGIIGNKKFHGAEIKKKGEIDFPRLYKKTIPWFESHHYFFTEKSLTSKLKSEGKEQKLEWTASKKVDDYYRFNINIELLITNWMKDRAEIVIRFKAFLEKDYKDLFERKFGKKFGKFLRKFREFYFISTKTDKMKLKLRTEATDLIEEVKKNLDFVTR